MTSLHARLLAWLLGGVLVVGAVGGFIVYRNALREADGFYDYQLEQTALILRDEPVEYGAVPRLPPAAPISTTPARSEPSSRARSELTRWASTDSPRRAR